MAPGLQNTLLTVYGRTRFWRIFSKLNAVLYGFEVIFCRYRRADKKIRKQTCSPRYQKTTCFIFKQLL